MLATSSVSGRQTFFAYHSDRKVVTSGEPGEDPEEPSPPAGDADITFQKVIAGTDRGLDGAVYNIYLDGQIVGSDVTSGGGYIEVNDVTEGLWSFVEQEAPAGYALDPTPHSVYVSVTDGDKQYTVTAEDEELPGIKVIKTSAADGSPVENAVYSIKGVTCAFSTSVSTGPDGSALVEDLPAGVYIVREESVPEPFVRTASEQTIALRPGKISEARFEDYTRPGLEIVKRNIADRSPIEGVTYQVRQIDGDFLDTVETDADGRAFLEVDPGSYEISEVNVPSHVIISEIPQTISLEPGVTRTVRFFNAVKPSLTILKRNSVTKDPLENAKFHIYYASDNTETGEINDLGTYYTDASGRIVLTDVNRGWYEIEVITHDQSIDIAEAVGGDKAASPQQGAGDQGIMYGYACLETDELLPLPVVLAHRLTRLLTDARKTGTIQGLGPDGKAQVSVEYAFGLPSRIISVVISCQHEADKSLDDLRREVVEYVVMPALQELPPDEETEILINPSGRFVLGGFEADTGLTGRKLMVDTYGGLVPHGGGALSGKDGTKVDRSGTYMARYIAKNIVAAGLAERCTVSLAYAIGKAEPVAVDIDTHGTGEYADTVLEQAVHMAFDWTPDGMIRTLGLDRPIFAQYCSYGHFMHADAPWEQTDKAELLEEICRFKEAGASRR